MRTEKIVIDNLKCHGCANTICKEIGKLEGVDNVVVNNEESSVTVDYDDKDEVRELIIKRLKVLGYPELGNNNLGAQVKSYVSCAIGRMSNNKK